MTSPTIVHRYTILAIEAVQALVDIGDCREVRISLDGGMLVVDVIAPATPAMAPTVADLMSVASNETPKSNVPSPAATEAHTEALAQDGSDIPDAGQDAPAAGKPAEPELKGGPLARRAAILCGMGGFQAWLEVASADEAKAEVCRRCGVESRRMLDHDAGAAATWRDIETRYQLWLDGYE